MTTTEIEVDRAALEQHPRQSERRSRARHIRAAADACEGNRIEARCSALARLSRIRTIASDRLLLRPWHDEDADFLLDLESRWEVVRFLGAQPTIMNNREDALASIARRRAIDDPIHGIWAITTAADGRLVGNLLLKPIPLSAGEPAGGPTDVEIGWHLHPDAWGHGYATEAAAAVLDDAFSRGLTRVIAVTDPDNRASQAVCRGLGMTHVGRTTRYYDTPNELFEKLAS